MRFQSLHLWAPLCSTRDSPSSVDLTLGSVLSEQVHSRN